MAKAKNTDEYIADAQSFAKPILKEIRSIVLEVCPDCEEKIKWLFPHFIHKGNLCSMAAFKEHCAFTFTKGDLMADPDNILEQVGKSAMGQFGKITSLKDLPPKRIFKKYLKEAMRLNEEGIKIPKKPSKANDFTIHPSFKKALAANKAANHFFKTLSPSNKKDYAEWITEAKTEKTRDKRIKTAIEWLTEEKPRNWKYMKKYK